MQRLRGLAGRWSRSRGGGQARLRPAAPLPCCVRSATTVEALADYAASRTVWMAQTDEIFIASTSQRAIPLFLGSFETNPTAHRVDAVGRNTGPVRRLGSAGTSAGARRIGTAGSLALDPGHPRAFDRVPCGSVTGPSARTATLEFSRRNPRAISTRFLALGAAAVGRIRQPRDPAADEGPARTAHRHLGSPGSHRIARQRRVRRAQSRRCRRRRAPVLFDGPLGRTGRTAARPVPRRR